MPNSNHSRLYYREQRRKHINRKKRIIHDLNDYWSYRYEGELSRSKIHCSCGMCMAKTRNKKYRRRHIHGNYAPNINYKHSDQQKIESAESQLHDYFEQDSLQLEAETADEDYLEYLTDTIDF